MGGGNPESESCITEVFLLYDYDKRAKNLFLHDISQGGSLSGTSKLFWDSSLINLPVNPVEMTD